MRHRKGGSKRDKKIFRRVSGNIGACIHILQLRNSILEFEIQVVELMQKVMHWTGSEYQWNRSYVTPTPYTRNFAYRSLGQSILQDLTRAKLGSVGGEERIRRNWQCPRWKYEKEWHKRCEKAIDRLNNKISYMREELRALDVIHHLTCRWERTLALLLYDEESTPTLFIHYHTVLSSAGNKLELELSAPEYWIDKDVFAFRRSLGLSLAEEACLRPKKFRISMPSTWEHLPSFPRR